MYTSVVALAGLLAVPASAFWRLPCVSPLVQERADPIVNPGQVSGHLHTIMGGNAFDFQMDADAPSRSSCSSCTVQGDNSNYWTPVLFYKGQDGTFEKVDQIGGATVYYLQRNAAGEDIKAFPKGFRMLAGDPFKRNAGSDAKSQAISYNCLDYSGGARPETGGFPTNNCPSGLRSQVFFPSCWDGKNLDSADHMSHVSYPDGAYNAGKCPSTHPVRLMALFYEIIWDTNKFANRWNGGTQPFVWSMGDPTGYGFHGDFINGWDVDLLQKAATQCTNLSGRVEDCPLFKLTPDSTASGCRVPSKLNDVITGKLNGLPGCNPVQQGPQRAVVATTGCTSSGNVNVGTQNNTSSANTGANTGSNANTGASTGSTTGTNTNTGISTGSSSNIINNIGSEAFFTDLTSKGWAYTGCATDNYYSRSIKDATSLTDTMTNEACIAFCQAKGYNFAGTEYARECYCGNTFPSDRMPIPGTPGTCDMRCKGNSTQWCGGAAKMSLYKKCESGKECKNADIGLSNSKPSTTTAVTTTKVIPTTMSTTRKVIPTTPAVHHKAARWVQKERQDYRRAAATAVAVPDAAGHGGMHRLLHKRRLQTRHV